MSASETQHIIFSGIFTGNELSAFGTQFKQFHLGINVMDIGITVLGMNNVPKIFREMKFAELICLKF